MLRQELTVRTGAVGGLGSWNGSAQQLVALWVFLTEVPMVESEEGVLVPLLNGEREKIDGLMRFARLVGVEEIKGVRTLRMRSRREGTGMIWRK